MKAEEAGPEVVPAQGGGAAPLVVVAGSTGPSRNGVGSEHVSGVGVCTAHAGAACGKGSGAEIGRVV